ncbi:MAG TPA: GNAT family N-acetyltransferase, partial [Candidatus Sulfotelmatobacter sp.]|nr:GNAT family N-acetyltransferase [Candidatus Sulfotelmatobacter sp.]
MSDVSLRPATAADLPAIEAIVGAAYEKYTPRIGKPAGPMLDDYAALVEQAAVTLAVLAGEAVGLLVLLDAADHLLLDNIAVRPDRQGHGIGRRLIAEAEIEARRRGFRDLRLYTHATMVE